MKTRRTAQAKKDPRRDTVTLTIRGADSDRVQAIDMDEARRLRDDLDRILKDRP